MKNILLSAILLLCSLPAIGQDNQVPEPKKSIRRIQINHADPMFIMLMLSGQRVTQPEYSTITRSLSGGGFGGFQNTGFGGASMGGFGQGRGAGGFGQGQGG